MQLKGVWLKIQTNTQRIFQFPSLELYNFQSISAEKSPGFQCYFEKRGHDGCLGGLLLYFLAH